MINYTLEYVLCYKEAFALGVATGILIAIYINRKKKPLTLDDFYP